MTASYPDLLASGVTSLGRFDPFDLFAGPGDPVTGRYQAADNQAIAQFEVCTLDAYGKLIPLTTTGDYATGGWVVGGQPTALDTCAVNGVTITFVSTTPSGSEVLIGSTTADTAQNLRDLINSDPDTYGVTASGSGTTVTLTATVIGTAGNSIALAEGVTSGSFTKSGTALSGGTAVSVVPRSAIAIAAQAVEAATPGAWVPVFIGGGFSHEALVWPAGIATLATRQLAFTGTPISIHQLL